MNQWSGTFTSQMYSPTLVNGSISTHLPEDITADQNREIRTQAMLGYGGLYRFGAQVQIEISGTPTQGHSQQPQSITFKGMMGTQQISFQCTNIQDNHISGVYSTINPADQGTFQLTKGAPANACILL